MSLKVSHCSQACQPLCLQAPLSRQLTLTLPSSRRYTIFMSYL